MSGRKEWASYEILTSSDMNEYLSDQVVMRFTDGTARGSALPTPGTGMITALDSAGGEPEYWGGSTWIPVSQGAAVSDVLAAGEAIDAVRISSGTTTLWGTGVWYQINAGTAVDLTVYASTGNSGFQLTEIGVGAAGSEQVIAIIGTNSDQRLANVRYGARVPASTRMAWRRFGASSTANNQNAQDLLCYKGNSGADPDVGRATCLIGTANVWVQVGTAPPLANGVWVTHLLTGDAASRHEFAFGSAGSEVVQTGSLSGIGGSTQIDFSPFFWPSNTRLSLRSTSSVGGGYVIWRETLDV